MRKYTCNAILSEKENGEIIELEREEEKTIRVPIENEMIDVNLRTTEEPLCK